MTRPKVDIVKDPAFTRQGDWPDAEANTRAELESLLHDMPGHVIDALVPAWNDFKSAERANALGSTPTEQVDAARTLGSRCIELAKVLQRADLQNIEASAWLAQSAIGVDLSDEMEAAAKHLYSVGACFLAAGNQGKPLVKTKTAKHNRDFLALAVLRAVRDHCNSNAEAEVLIELVLEAAGAAVPDNLGRYRRRIAPDDTPD